MVPRRKPIKCKKTGRRAYKDKIAAMLALADTQRYGSSNRNEKRVYVCPFCGKYHLTSMDKHNPRTSE